MWISQVKSTMAGRFRFVQRTSNIIVKFFSGFEGAICNLAPKWPDTRNCGVHFLNPLSFGFGYETNTAGFDAQ